MEAKCDLNIQKVLTVLFEERWHLVLCLIRNARMEILSTRCYDDGRQNKI